jgi:hypothetical protein
MSPGKFLKSSIKIRGSFKKILKIKNLFPLLFVIKKDEQSFEI